MSLNNHSSIRIDVKPNSKVSCVSEPTVADQKMQQERTYRVDNRVSAQYPIAKPKKALSSKEPDRPAYELKNPHVSGTGCKDNTPFTPATPPTPPNDLPRDPTPNGRVSSKAVRWGGVSGKIAETVSGRIAGTVSSTADGVSVRKAGTVSGQAVSGTISGKDSRTGRRIRGGRYQRRRNRNRNRNRNKNRKAPRGIMYLYTTFNNIIISVANLQGKVFLWSSAGINKFKGARKSSPFAAKVTARKIAKRSRAQGLWRVKLHVRGTGRGRKPAIRALFERGVRFTDIVDTTRLAHNGCRPPKRRRL
jgi:small subunit ribosomal protein S11